MADNNNNQVDQNRQEIMMAGGPVSAGAENKDEPMQNRQSAQDPMTKQEGQGAAPDYQGMLHTNVSNPTLGSGMATGSNTGTPGAGALPSDNPNDITSPRGGMNTSNSTPGAGSSAAGGVAGLGAVRDRGGSTMMDVNSTTNTKGILDAGSGDLNGEQAESQGNEH